MGLLEEHLLKYPLMQTEDKIKLLMQSIMGPGHLISDKDIVRENLINEYNLCKDLCCNYDLIEDIGLDYVRIYIKPYFEYRNSFDKLIEAFVLSANNKGDINFLKESLIKLKESETDYGKNKIDEYLNNGKILISHSKLYKQSYHPHYLVVNKKYLNTI